MTTLTPLGHLSVLPGEIREHVYYQLVAKRYRGYYSNSITRPANYGKDNYLYTISTRRRRKTYTGLVILRLSKTIHEEAMSILYARSLFDFHHVLVSGTLSPIPESPNTKITDRLMNIEIYYSQKFDVRPLDFTEDWAQQYMASQFFCKAPLGPLEIFRAGDVQRNSLTVVLELDDWASYAFKLITSPLFLAIKEFTMFRSVILRLSIAPESYCPAIGTTRKVIKEWEAAEQYEELYAGLDSVLHAMSKSLEGTLGPRSTSCPFQWRQFGGLSRQIEFHPRDHLTRISEMEIDLSGMEKERTVFEQPLDSMHIEGQACTLSDGPPACPFPRCQIE